MKATRRQRLRTTRTLPTSRLKEGRLAYGSKLIIRPLDTALFEAITKGKARAFVLYEDNNAPIKGDAIELVCTNSKGLVEEFSPKRRMYVTHAQRLEQAHSSLAAKGLDHLFIVSLAASAGSVDDDN